MSRRTITLLILCGLLALLAAALAAPPTAILAGYWSVRAADREMRRNLPLHPEPRPFEADAWRNDSSGFCEIRLAMMDDVIASRVLIGRTREELTALLGRGDVPENSGSLDLKDQLAQWDLVFSVGCRNLSDDWFDPFGIDCSYLVVRFDAHGRVADAGIVSQ